MNGIPGGDDATNTPDGPTVASDTARRARPHSRRDSDGVTAIAPNGTPAR